MIDKKTQGKKNKVAEGWESDIKTRTLSKEMSPREIKKEKQKQGKKNKAAGARFELKVRKDLEDKGRIVSKWMNNVVLPLGNIVKPGSGMPAIIVRGYLTPAKHKFRGLGRPMAIGTGFPDFIAFRYGDSCDCGHECGHIEGIEVKSNGYLDKIEKEKCKWLLDNNIFSKILIASKGEKRGTIKYKEV